MKTPHKIGHLWVENTEYVQKRGKARSIRLCCILERNVMQCFGEAQGDLSNPEVVNKIKTESKPKFSLNLEECIRVEACPITIEESIEKMRQRKKNNLPYKFEVDMHGSKHRETLVNTITFTAQAAGDVKNWIRMVRKAMWIGPTVRTFNCSSKEKGKPMVTLKVLLHKTLHPEKAQKHSIVTNQKNCPRGVVLQVDGEEFTGSDLSIYLSRRVGISPKCIKFYKHEKPRQLLAEGHMNNPLLQWLERSLPAVDESKLTDPSSETRCRHVLYASVSNFPFERFSIK